MKHDFDQRHLNLTAFAQAQGRLTGEEPLVSFGRLLLETQGVGSQAPVSFSARGEMRMDDAGTEQVWLHLSGEVVLALVCQRCLGPADILVSFERAFRFVATEEQAEREDDVSDEDVLVMSRAFNVLELVEDEILLALPITPMHQRCPIPLKLQVADRDFVEGAGYQKNPFGILEQFRKKDLP